ncbi:MAG: hypothetical protein AAFN78_17295, partial [Pseudomonadota bacterium]
MNHLGLASVFGALALSLAATAGAGVTTIELNGVDSWDLQGDSDNVILAIDLGPATAVTGIGWAVDITPVGFSWYSEATLLFTDSLGGQGVSVTPGAGDDFAGAGIPMSYSSGGIIDLTNAGIPNIRLADG